MAEESLVQKVAIVTATTACIPLFLQTGDERSTSLLEVPRR